MLPNLPLRKSIDPVVLRYIIRFRPGNVSLTLVPSHEPATVQLRQRTRGFTLCHHTGRLRRDLQVCLRKVRRLGH